MSDAADVRRFVIQQHSIDFTLHGKRVSGKYALFSMRGTRDWLIHRMDPPDDPDRAPRPRPGR